MVTYANVPVPMVRSFSCYSPHQSPQDIAQDSDVLAPASGGWNGDACECLTRSLSYGETTLRGAGGIETRVPLFRKSLLDNYLAHKLG